MHFYSLRIFYGYLRLYVLYVKDNGLFCDCSLCHTLLVTWTMRWRQWVSTNLFSLSLINTTSATIIIILVGNYKMMSAALNCMCKLYVLIFGCVFLLKSIKLCADVSSCNLHHCSCIYVYMYVCKFLSVVSVIHR